ncbi:unnamed protein product, partial [Coregonus sp. 'balchen']
MSNRKHRDNQEICARKVRELAQAGVNKHCFECSQPGVTYIDITVGCFVCTSCSGMLRGLNPPHRVKSISMTTFSQQEVEFLQNHGNEVSDRQAASIIDRVRWACGRDLTVLHLYFTHLISILGIMLNAQLDTSIFQQQEKDKYEKKKWHFSKNKCRREVEGPWSPPGSQSQLSSRVPAISPADMKAEVFTARAPSRSQSFRDPPMKAPFRAFPKSLSVDFGGLSQQHSHSALSITPPAPAPGPNTHTNHQDRYAALSQLNSVFSDISPGVDAVSGSQTFANFPNPFSCSSSSQQQQPALSPSNPFNSSTSGGDSSGFVSSPTSVFLPSTTFPTPANQNAFPHKHANNQEANGKFCLFPCTGLSTQSSSSNVSEPIHYTSENCLQKLPKTSQSSQS